MPALVTGYRTSRKRLCSCSSCVSFVTREGRTDKGTPVRASAGSARPTARCVRRQRERTTAVRFIRERTVIGDLVRERMRGDCCRQSEPRRRPLRVAWARCAGHPPRAPASAFPKLRETGTDQRKRWSNIGKRWSSTRRPLLAHGLLLGPHCVNQLRRSDIDARMSITDTWIDAVILTHADGSRPPVGGQRNAPRACSFRGSSTRANVVPRRRTT